MLAVKEFEDDKFVVMGTRQRRDQEDRAVGVQQPAGRRHHCDGRRRGRRGDRRAGDRRHRARSSSARATAWRFASRKPTCGRWAAPPTAFAASRCATTTTSWRWRWCKPGGTLLTVTERGYGKRTEIDEYRVQSRGGVGIINISTSDRNGAVVGVAYVQEGDELLLITQQGMILRMLTNDVRVDRPRDAGRPADRRRRRGPGRVDRAARRKRRRDDPATVATAVVGGGPARWSRSRWSPRCGHPAERALVDQFFAASRLRDRTAAQAIATMFFDPKDDGIISQFTISSVTPEEESGGVVSKNVHDSRLGRVARAASRRKRRSS